MVFLSGRYPRLGGNDFSPKDNWCGGREIAKFQGGWINAIVDRWA